MNYKLAEYHGPVNADIGEVNMLMLNEQDELVAPPAIKRVGELGVRDAVANAVNYANCIRRRKLPIRIESLIGNSFARSAPAAPDGIH